MLFDKLSIKILSISFSLYSVVQINVGCRQSFSYQSPVLLQYSHDAGLTWSLVSEPCYLPDKCGQLHDQPYSEGSIYFAGPYGEWRTVIIPLDSNVAAKYVRHFVYSFDIKLTSKP